MGHLLPKCRHQAGQFQQVFQAERRAAGRDSHDWIWRNYVRPFGRNADQLIVVVTVVDPVLAPVLSDGYNGKLLAVAGMEGMDDAECSRRTVCTGCNRRCRQIRSSKDSGAPFAESFWTM